MKIMIGGDARHGKDTVAGFLKKHFGLSFESSSQAASDIFLYKKLKSKYGYLTSEECFQDRVNHRPEWKREIKAYNTPDKARLARKIMSENSIYVGMRCPLELRACLKENLFDVVLGVVDPRKEPESSASNELDIQLYANNIIYNNGTLPELEAKVLMWGVRNGLTRISTERTWGTDIDGVCADFDPHYLEYLGFPNQTPSVIYDDPRIVNRFSEVKRDSAFWRTMPVFKKIPKGLTPSKYITARPVESWITRQWLQRHDFPEAEVITTFGDSKIIHLDGIDVFVEDSPSNFEEIRPHVLCLLMDTPYNREVETDFRIYSLGDVVKFI